ncbi:MAG: DNA repair protein RadC [Mariprofundaceae bacterium]|nr:DNA repair protein RadC [Mariprofundaceae bacterium]
MADESVTHHRMRLRQRFASHGLSGFQDYEVLELLLTYAIPRKDVKPMAKRLLQQFDSLVAVLDAPTHAIETVEGLGVQSAILLHLVRELNTRYLLAELPKKNILNAPEKVKEALRLSMQGRTTECFGVIFLDQQHCYLQQEIMFEGTIDRAAVYPRELVRRALEVQAKAIIIFHNHPAGKKQASTADIEVTRKIEAACNTLDIRLLDHFLLAGTEVLSFREHGWFSPVS